MRLVTKIQNMDENEKLENLTRDVHHHIYSYVELVAELQEEVSKMFIEEYGINGAIDVQSISRMARIMSKYAASDCFRELRKYPNVVQNHFNSWQKLRKDAMQIESSQLRRKYSIIPAKLSFYYLFNGELCKGVVCLLDYVDLMPYEYLAVEVALRWLLFLGETELAEKKLKTWRMEKCSQEFFEACKLGVAYVKNKETRPEVMRKLIEMRDRIKKENIRSFPKYDLASFVYWLCSTLSNVAVSENLDGHDFPDRLSHLQEATAKADAIIRNRVPGLASYQFNNSISSSIMTYLEGKQSGSATEYIHLGSALAWHFELRREWALVNVSTAQGRDSMSAMILNMRTALKSACLFRIIQATNTMAYYTAIIEEPGSEDNAKIARASLVNLISADPIIVHCSTPVKSSIPSRAQTPLPGQKLPMGNEKNSDTMLQEVADRLSELEIINEQAFHPISRTCGCNVCLQYPSSSTFAAEYMFAYCIFSDFSQFSIQQFNAEFACIRERDMVYQALMHKDKCVRPRPNIIQNEVFGMCVVQWLIRKIDRKELVDEESLEVFKNAMKIVKYLHSRTIDLQLAITQLGRQLECPQNCNYSWMQPVVRKPIMKASIGCAVDILRAVSPFGRRPKMSTPENEGIVNSPRFVAIRNEMRTDMTRYGHILYRDWRCRMFPYIGRTSDNPWEAAYAWAESTSIGSRNAVQSKLEKCRKGLVTISGPERFKKCVEAMPDDMTIVNIAMADNKQIYLIKLHADREPIIMPLAHHSQATELMEKFTFLLDEDERIAKFPGDMTPEEFWKKRKLVDARMMTFVEEVQNNFFDVSARLLMPSDRLGPAAQEIAEKICRLSKQSLRLGEAKDMVNLSEHMDFKSWEKLCLRFCEMRTKEQRFVDNLPNCYKLCVEALNKDRTNGAMKSVKKYTYLVVCSKLSQFCWERLPIFDDFPYVGRQVCIHSTFSQLEAMRNKEKQIPLQIDVQNAYYVLDPENNLGDTKRRMLDYINKFKWEGTVGSAPNSQEITSALAKRDAFFYFGHGSGSSVMPRSVIKQATCNAISMLMGCGSVRTIPQAHGFDGKSALLDYAMAKCPLIVGCLWTVTDGEIDRYLMRMIDDCFEKTRGVTGVDKLRQLSEAMAEARSKSKLKFLTGAAVVMYGLPVVSKPSDAEKENRATTPSRDLILESEVPITMSQQAYAVPKTPPRQPVLRPQQHTDSSSVSVHVEILPKTPRQTESKPRTPRRAEVMPKTPQRGSKSVLSPIQPSEPDTRSSRSLRTPRASSRTAPATKTQLFDEEPEPQTSKPMRTRSSARTPSRSRLN